MVMEAAPTPQCVGREFVRQYYTLLNKAPLHLHRFYSQNSSFLHGGLDRPGQETKPVVGQQDIHEKIMQLNFKDCHAKIRQVDSHETLSDGVVVQVTGELSNNGQPMRRFMQTFVLAPQSPKKYYVRNDIFRYQDEIFTDDDETENDNALADTDVEEAPSQKQPQTDALQDAETGYYEPEIVRNGSIHANEVVAKYTVQQQQQQQVEVSDSPQPELDVESPKSGWEEEEVEEDEELEEEEEEMEDSIIAVERTTGNSITSEVESIPPVSQEPKTYANMVSKNTGVSNPANISAGPTATSPVTSAPLNKMDQTQAFHKPDTGMHSSIHAQNNPQNMSFGPPNNRSPRARMSSGRSAQRYEPRENTTRLTEDFDAEKRKPPLHPYPDSHQLFIGNLIHSITEEDLKQHFMQYGNVLDMRINTKQTMKAGGTKVPNFGFIVFENPESVQKVLDQKPIFFKEHRLNVEEKKRPKETRIIGGDNRIGPGRGGLPPRVNIGRGGGGRGGMLGGPQGAGRGDMRGGMKGGNYLRR